MVLFSRWFRRAAPISLLALTAAGGIAGGLLLAPQVARASFRLVPIEMDMEPSGRGATQIFRVQNDGQEPVAIEISTMARAMDEQGEDHLTDAEDDFAVFPEQIILQPGETQSVRVQWVGDTHPTRELPFRLIAQQLDVNLSKTPTDGGQVRLLVKYVASVYIVPAGATPKVVVVSAGAAPPASTTPLPNQPAPPSQAGKAMLEVVVRNDGTSHQILRDPTLTLTAGGKSVTLAKEQLAGLTGENVLAGATRRFHLPWPADLPAGVPVTATLHLP